MQKRFCASFLVAPLLISSMLCFGQSKSIKVSVEVSAQEPTKSLNTSLINRELRKLGDIEIVLLKPEWNLRIIAFQIGEGRASFYVLSLLVTRPMEEAWIETCAKGWNIERTEYKKSHPVAEPEKTRPTDPNRKMTDWGALIDQVIGPIEKTLTGFYMIEDHRLYTITPDELETSFRNIIASVDSNIFQKQRVADQIDPTK